MTAHYACNMMIPCSLRMHTLNVAGCGMEPGSRSSSQRLCLAATNHYHASLCTELWLTHMQACAKHGIPAGTFCFGVQKSKEQAHQGFKHIGFDVDTNMLMASASVSLKELRAS